MQDADRGRRGKRWWRWWALAAVAIVIALRIAFWGQPVETHSQMPLETGAPGVAARSTWVIERSSSRSAETWRARDTDGDGVMDEFDTPSGAFARPGLRAEPKRWLIICLDGVPLGAMQNLWDRGHFHEYFRPTASVSVFPSDSEAALTTVLRAAPPPGYEHRYFDRTGNELRGGWWVTLTGYAIPYIAALDYDPPGWAKALPYVMPAKTYRADLGRLREHFLASRERIFLAHISASDSLFHLWTAQRIEPFLLEFEGVLRDLYLDARGELGVLVFSDHGNTETPSRAAPLAELLAQRGWRRTNSLARPRDVVVPPYGLVGFAAVYCQPSATQLLARDLAQLEGTDLVVFRDEAARAPAGAGTASGSQGRHEGMTDQAASEKSSELARMSVLPAESVRVLSAVGEARLAWNADGSRFWYKAASGDPLELLPIFVKLRAEGRLAADGSAGDVDLFTATWAAQYPDAPARLRDWAINHVQNPASILLSFKPGYYHGAGVFQHIVSIAGTHGALDAASSLGFAMSTRTLPPATRLGELLPREWLRVQGAGGRVR